MNETQFAAARKAAPADVRMLIDRWENCNHWNGEWPSETSRAHEIDRALKTLQCDRLPRDVAVARRRYLHHEDIQRLIVAAHGWFD